MADTMRTAMTLQYAALPNYIPQPVVNIIQKTRTDLCQIYLDTYIGLSGCLLEDLKQWELPIMAARLIENVPNGEKTVLLNQIRESI